MSAALKHPDLMTVEEFLKWDAPGPYYWQLIDGVPDAMAPPGRVHARIQSELSRLVDNHLVETGRPCHAFVTPGVKPRAQSSRNMRVPDVAVSCTPDDGGDRELKDPILIIEILSPSNHARTWANVWTYETIPSVQEILIVQSESMGIDLLRRGPDGAWPTDPETILEGPFTLTSIGLTLTITDLYRGTWLLDRG